MSDFDRPARIPWPPLLVIACAITGWILSPATEMPVWVTTSGFALVAVGIALDAYCAWFLLSRKTAVLPNRAATHLVTDGPYRFSRNPIYLGYVQVLIGLAIVRPAAASVFIIPVFVVLIEYFSIKPEEAHLAARFDDEWRAFQARTPRWFGPF
jgi:protein-S-isoprenylcysteine O-methyltransferase Ste14